MHSVGVLGTYYYCDKDVLDMIELERKVLELQIEEPICSSSSLALQLRRFA